MKTNKKIQQKLKRKMMLFTLSSMFHSYGAAKNKTGGTVHKKLAVLGR